MDRHKVRVTTIPFIPLHMYSKESSHNIKFTLCCFHLNISALKLQQHPILKNDVWFSQDKKKYTSLECESVEVVTTS